MKKQHDARRAAEVPELQLAVHAAAAAAAALRCVAAATRGCGSAVQLRQLDPASASVLRELVAAAAQSAATFARVAERCCSAAPSGVARRQTEATANAEPALPAGGAPPAGSDRTSRRAAQRRRQRQRRSAAATASPPQAAPVQTGAVSAAATWMPPPEFDPLMWGALAAAAPPFAPRTAAPGGPLPQAGVGMADVHFSDGEASTAVPMSYSFGTSSSQPPPRGKAGRKKKEGRPQPVLFPRQLGAQTGFGRVDVLAGRSAARR